MADTLTANSLFTKNEYRKKAWHTTEHVNWDAADALHSAVLTKALTADATLMTAEALGKVLVFTGSAGALNVTLPRAGSWVVVNSTNGNLTFKRLAGDTGKVVPSGAVRNVTANATNVLDVTVDASSIGSGMLPDGRVAESNVTQHQGALAIAWSQLTGGAISSATLAGAVTNETGSGALVFATSPTLVTPILGAASATSIMFGAGTPTAPPMAFSGDTNTGFYSVGEDQLGVVTAGTLRWTFGATGHFIPNADEIFHIGDATHRCGILFATAMANGAWPTTALVSTTGTTARFGAGSNWTGLQLFTAGAARRTVGTTTETATLVQLGPAGAVSAPAYSFSVDTDTGIYSISGDILGLAAGGTLILSLQSAAAEFFTTMQAATGSATVPTYSFSGDGNTGIYREGGDILGFATGGVKRAVIDASGILKVNGGNSEVLHVGKVFVGADQTITGNQTMNTFAHGLGATPSSVEAYIRCVTADAAVSGAVGDVRPIQTQNGGNAANVMCDGANVYVRWGTGGNSISNWVAGLGASNFTYANWKVYVIARLF